MTSIDPITPHMHALLHMLYSSEAAGVAARLAAVLANNAALPIRPALSNRDAVLITYGDMVRAEGEPPLRTLATFARRHLSGVANSIHLLPHYPYTSDDGFSVVDYRAVNPALGDWDDVRALGEQFTLMFDAVINHVSVSSEYMRGFANGDPRFARFAKVIDNPDDPRLKLVTRPRTLPLLTPLQTPHGTKHVWTTFSADQIDLNYEAPEVLLEVIEVLLAYARHGARFIRLDAIAFMWKELGTNCVHLPQTHAIIKLLRAVLDCAAPGTVLITETNVPHADNVSYFGNGADEARMVYNFALPPLVLHTFRNGNAGVLTQWARSLTLPSKQTTFFNFLASHDGIGLNPARGILPESDVLKLAEGTLARGGFINYKHMPDGSQVPYEMNINYLDALGEIAENRPQTADSNRPAPGAQHSKDKVDAKRMLAAHAIALALQGVPGIYFHSLFGSRGWPDGVQQHGYNRAINRQKLTLDALELELTETGSLRRAVFDGMTAMLRARANCRAFDPFGEQQVLDLGPEAFAVLRLTERNANFKDRVVCLVNVTGDDIFLNVDWRSMLGTRHAIHNLITGTKFNVHGPSLMLRPYQVMWATVGM